MGVYVDINDIKDLLLSRPDIRAGGRRIDFSENIRDLRTGSKNVGNISLARVDMDDSFAGFVDFIFTFTSPSAFDLTMKPEGNEINIAIGSGTIGAVFTAINPWTVNSMFVIQPSYWSGLADTSIPDTVRFRSNSVLSNTVVENRFIIDASRAVDQQILASQRMSIVDRQNLLFTALDIPGPVQTAALKITAFGIVEAVHGSGDISKSTVFMWYQEARTLIKEYIASIIFRGPSWVSRAPIVPMSIDDKIGTPMFGLDDTRQTIIKSFEDLLNRFRDYKVNQNYIGFKST